MDIVGEVKKWVRKSYKTDRHLLRAEYWLKKIGPRVSEEEVIAVIAHDIERAFPENRKPPSDPIDKWDDRKYNLWHGRRSARFLGNFLKEVGVKSKSIARIKYLVIWHEIGGDRKRDLIKDADSISFLENNIEFFLKRTREIEKFKKQKVSRNSLREKFDYMFHRISSPRAKRLALPFYKKAIAKLERL